MNLRKALFDTNLYIDWLNRGRHEELMTGAGLVRYMSSVVHMELRVGAKMLPARRAVDQLVRAYRSGGRMLVPTDQVYEQAGRTLSLLREGGREVRRASLVSDVLIALSAHALGATVFTADADFVAIQSVVDFKLELVAL